MHGRVLNLQRMSTDDGPGIRTTVFLKGCSLACSWCHNPESISPRPELVWHERLCILCGCCVETCSHEARVLGDDGARVDAERCILCADCAESCPTTAVELVGRRWEVDALVAELSKDRAYFETSGGGITVSGGEPALQPAFAKELLKRCQSAGLHTALDTCGMCNESALLGLIPHANLVLFDLKDLDDERHQRFAGASNATVLSNARAVADHVRRDASKTALWIRTPLIPGATAREDNLRAIGRFIASELGEVVERWELCSFNNLCEDKYRRLGQRWMFAGTPLLTAAELEHFAAVARDSGVAPDKVRADGPTRFLQGNGAAPPNAQ